jgi:ppGpp synthetase/RelA/SpoT-type nucleotidyltranferase
MAVSDAFHRAFFGQYELERTIRAKQFRSIVAKLERQRTRLSRIQDLLGFRVVVDRIGDQELLIDALPSGPDWTYIDRRQTPSHGYRAVHIVRHGSLGSVEVQIRTLLQHRWAELSEYFDRRDPGVKYGHGDEEVRRMLELLSIDIGSLEEAELEAESPEDLRELREAYARVLDDMLRQLRLENGT